MDKIAGVDYEVVNVDWMEMTSDSDRDSHDWD